MMLGPAERLHDLGLLVPRLRLQWHDEGAALVDDQQRLASQRPRSRLRCSKNLPLFAARSLNFVVRAWVKTGDWGSVRWDLLRSFKVEFDKAGLNMPYPQQDVHLHGLQKQA